VSCSATSEGVRRAEKIHRARTREKQRQLASTTRSERPEFLPRPNREGYTIPGRDGGHSQAVGRGCARRSNRGRAESRCLVSKCDEERPSTRASSRRGRTRRPSRARRPRRVGSRARGRVCSQSTATRTNLSRAAIWGQERRARSRGTRRLAMGEGAWLQRGCRDETRAREQEGAGTRDGLELRASAWRSA
jgi:hypothetical protein